MRTKRPGRFGGNKPVFYRGYRFENNLNELAGTGVLYTVGGAPTYYANAISGLGQCVLTNKLLHFPNNTVFRFSGAFSVCFWVDLDVLPASATYGTFIIHKGVNAIGGSNTTEYRIQINKSNVLQFLVYDSTGNAMQAAYTGTWSTSAQYHITATYDGTDDENGLKLYLNGSLLTTTKSNGGFSGGIRQDGGYAVFGAFNNGSDQEPMRLDNMYFFNGVLTDENVSAIYTTEVGGSNYDPTIHQ